MASPSALKRRPDLPGGRGINRESDFHRFVAVYHTVKGVPWEEDGSRAFDGDHVSLTRIVGEGLARRGETPEFISYFAQSWILEGVKFLFSGVPQELFHPVRKYVLWLIIRSNWRSMITITHRLNHLRRFFRIHTALHPESHARYIHAHDVIATLDASDISKVSQMRVLGELVEFRRFIELNYALPAPEEEIRELEAHRDHLSRTLPKRFAGKFPDIPDEPFYRIFFAAIQVLRDDAAPHDDVIMAGAILLHMWTGLRPKEIRMLRRGCVFKEVRSGKTMFFLQYRSSKNGNRVQTTFLFPAALEAEQTMERVLVDEGYEGEGLIHFEEESREDEAADDFVRRYDNFLRKYMGDYLSVPRKGLRPTSGKRRVIYRPILYSYRVHLCTYLVDHGLDERWVAAHMGHLVASMRGYYYRIKNRRREAIQKDLLTTVPGVADAVQGAASLLARKASLARQRKKEQQRAIDAFTGDLRDIMKKKYDK